MEEATQEIKKISAKEELYEGFRIHKVKYLMLSVVTLLLLALAIFFILQIRQNNNTSSQDTFSQLRKKNSNYNDGYIALVNGDYAIALENYKKALIESKNPSDRAVIDIGIANAQFGLNRSLGIDEYIRVSKEVSYSKRNRAYAMMQAFLLYNKYQDEVILRKLLAGYEIQASNKKEFITKYMNKILDLHPFAMPLVYLASYEIDDAKDKATAQAVYDKYILRIDTSIAELQKNPGEGTFYASALAGKAALKSRLYIDFQIGDAAEIGAFYESNINNFRSLGLKTSEQNAILSYANFLIGSKNYTKGEEVLQQLINGSIDPSIVEAMPKMSRTTKSQTSYLFNLLSETKNEAVKSFINNIGSANLKGSN